ncbi:MAG: TetR/AcrR family transcriptional regulator [Nitrospirota bacterium]
MARGVRRAQIAEAALRIIAQRGVRALTTAALAEEVGISEANLYRHFKNKEEILAETVERIGAGLRENLESAFRSSASPLARLKKVFQLHLEYIEKNEGIPRLGFSEEMHIGSKELGEKLLGTITAYRERLEALIKEGKKAGLIKKDIEPHASALMVIGMIQVTIFLWSLSGFSFPLMAEGMKMWDNYERCIKA